MAADWDGDDPLKANTLGYGRPPKWTRFQPGKSGNPRGRPRKTVARTAIDSDSPSDVILRRELSKKRRYKEGGEIKLASTAELLTRAGLESALKGNPLAQRDIDRQRRELEKLDRARERQAEKRQVDQFERMVRYRDFQEKLYAKASEAEAVTFELGPHPDDITLDYVAKRWHVRGPVGPDDLPRFNYLAAERYASFFRAMIKERACIKGQVKHCTLSEISWLLYEEQLPKRWQLRHRNFKELHFCMMVMPMRTLRILLRKAEREAEELKASARLPARSRDAYQIANTILKPLCNSLGWKSLAHFEHEYEESQGELKLVCRERKGGAR